MLRKQLQQDWSRLPAVLASQHTEAAGKMKVACITNRHDLHISRHHVNSRRSGLMIHCCTADCCNANISSLVADMPRVGQGCRLQPRNLSKAAEHTTLNVLTPGAAAVPVYAQQALSGTCCIPGGRPLQAGRMMARRQRSALDQKAVRQHMQHSTLPGLLCNTDHARAKVRPCHA